MKELKAIYRATALEFLRDKTALILTMILPLVMAGFFGLIFSGDHTSAAGYVPGMMGLGMLWLGVFGTAPPLVQLREQQILRRLSATPLTRPALLGAQVAWRLTTGLLQTALMVLFGVVAYGMRPHAGWWTMLAAAVLGNLVMVAVGFFLASVARTNESVIALGQVVQFPMMFLSGILFPLEMLPAGVRGVANILPLTYLGDALKQGMLGTPGLHPLWLDFAVMGGCLALLGALSSRFFRWG